MSAFRRDYWHKFETQSMVPHRKASLFASIFSETLQVITDCIRIQIKWQMMDNPPEERGVCHNPIIFIRYYTCACWVCVRNHYDLWFFLLSVYTESVQNDNTAIEKANSLVSVWAACSPSMCSLVSLHFLHLIITETQTEGPTNSQFPIPSCSEQ